MRLPTPVELTLVRWDVVQVAHSGRFGFDALEKTTFGRFMEIPTQRIRQNVLRSTLSRRAFDFSLHTRTPLACPSSSAKLPSARPRVSRARVSQPRRYVSRALLGLILSNESTAGKSDRPSEKPMACNTAAPPVVAQVSLSLAKPAAVLSGLNARLGLKSSSGLLTLRAILHDALPKNQTTRVSKFDEPGAAGAALVAALVVYSGVAWL
jgi:hypothetical protein|tara:strand:- start:2242 stop:2868 length:627 start_codon:yes stop_codon:yes gene_type:complete